MDVRLDDISGIGSKSMSLVPKSGKTSQEKGYYIPGSNADLTFSIRTVRLSIGNNFRTGLLKYGIVCLGGRTPPNRRTNAFAEPSH